MKKAKKGRKFGRLRDDRKALLRSLLRAMVLQKKITTTEAKAKELRPQLEKLVSRAKEGGLTTHRFLAKKASKEVAQALIQEIAPQYKERQGGYTRIIKLPRKRGSGAKMARIEFV